MSKHMAEGFIRLFGLYLILITAISILRAGVNHVLGESVYEGMAWMTFTGGEDNRLMYAVANWGLTVACAIAILMYSGEMARLVVRSKESGDA